MPSFPRLFACLALLGTFVIDNPHCGANRHDHPQLALRYLEEERFDQALAETRRALREKGGDPTLYLLAAMAHLGKQEIEAGIQALASGLEFDPNDARIHLALRDICQQTERFDLARALLEEMLKRHPDNPRILAGLGWAHMQLEEEEKAVELLAAAVEQGDPELFAHAQLSRLYLLQERFDLATQVLQDALDIAPDDPQLLLALGECQLQQGMADEAIGVFEQALEKGAAPVAIAIRIAQSFYQQGMRHRAIEYYERALQHEGAGALLLNNLAWAYAEEGIRLDHALSLATRAVKMDADNVVYLDTYAELFYQKGQHARAIAVMHRALELEPEGGEHYRYLREQMEKFQRRDVEVR